VLDAGRTLLGILVVVVVIFPKVKCYNSKNSFKDKPRLNQVSERFCGIH